MISALTASAGGFRYGGSGQAFSTLAQVDAPRTTGGGCNLRRLTGSCSLNVTRGVGTYFGRVRPPNPSIRPVRRSLLMFHPMRIIEASDGRAIPRGIGFSIEVAPTSIGVVDSGAEGADNAKEQRYLTGRRGVLTHFPANIGGPQT